MTSNRALADDKSGLLDAMDQSWAAVQEMLDRIGEEGMTVPTDAAGWTGKDHLTHLAAWERSMVFLLRGKPRHEGLGVDEAIYLGLRDDDASYETRDYDAINATIRDATRGMTLAEAVADLAATHNELRARIVAMTEDDLRRPYAWFLPDEPDDDGRPIVSRLDANAGFHIVEHIGYIEIIAASG